MAKTIKECGGKLLDINGGERINSIPANVKAIIATNQIPISSHENMEIVKIEGESEHLSVYHDNVINFIYAFANGVRGYDKELHVVLTSINMAIIKTSVDALKIELSARSMDNDELKRIKDETISMLEHYGFEVTTNGKYPAWKPQINEFTEKVLETYKKHVPAASLKPYMQAWNAHFFKINFPI